MQALPITGFTAPTPGKGYCGQNMFLEEFCPVYKGILLNRPHNVIQNVAVSCGNFCFSILLDILISNKAHSGMRWHSPHIAKVREGQIELQIFPKMLERWACKRLMHSSWNYEVFLWSLLPATHSVNEPFTLPVGHFWPPLSWSAYFQHWYGCCLVLPSSWQYLGCGLLETSIRLEPNYSMVCFLDLFPH